MQHCHSNITLTGPKTPREKAMEKKQDTDQNIQVFLRCRPLDTSRQPPEKKAPLEVDRIRREVKVTEKNVDKGTRSFFFDDVYDASIGQCEVYDGVVKPLVSEVLQGYNCTVFAYGQTGTGKTYTMEGSRSDYECSWQDDPKAGIVPRALDQLFEALSERGSTEHTISVSYMELYNENLYDLLSPCSDLVKLNIYEDNTQKGKVKVGNLAEISVAKKDEIFDILRKGSAKRQTAATKLNACSSRSHTIFSVTVRMKDLANLMDGEEIYRIGKLNMVDLAGSENIGRSGAIEKRATEAGQINRSLLTLGRVITCLVEKQSHIPYRESKLTRLLQDSLGGRTKTSIIATISPSTLDLEDTLSTLEYAQRAKKITNKPELNQKLTKNTVLKELTAEIERLRRDVDASRGAGNAFYIAKENYDQMSEQIDKQNKDLESKEKHLANLEEELERIKILFGETEANLEKKTQQLHEVRTNLHEIKETLTQTRQELQTVTIDRDEQKHLVEVHVKTEKELGNQARVLLDVANISTTHVDRLQQKVERVKRIEETNLQAASTFLNTFETGMKNAADCVKVLNSGQIEDLQSFLEGKFDSLQAGQADLNDDISSMSTSLSSKLTEMKDEFEKESAARVSDLNQLGETFGKTSKLSAEQCTNLINQLDTAKEEGRKSYEALNEHSLNQRASIENKILEISGVINKAKEVTNASKKQLVSEMKDIFTSFIAKIDSLQAKHDAVLDDAMNCINLLDESVSQHLQETQDKINNAESALASSFESLAAAVDTQRENIKNHIVKCVSQSCELAKTTEDAVAQQSANLISLSTDVAKQADVLMVKVRGQIDNLSEGKEASVNEVALLKVQTKMAQKNLLKELDDRSSQVKSFVQADLKKDTPTGQTPMKTSFSYPKNLVETSPHPRILARFRQTLENVKPE